jgi:outer membrane murein-binding lipoprotein Lpp
MKLRDWTDLLMQCTEYDFYTKFLDRMHSLFTLQQHTDFDLDVAKLKYIVKTIKKLNKDQTVILHQAYVTYVDPPTMCWFVFKDASDGKIYKRKLNPQRLSLFLKAVEPLSEHKGNALCDLDDWMDLRAEAKQLESDIFIMKAKKTDVAAHRRDARRAKKKLPDLEARYQLRYNRRMIRQGLRCKKKQPKLQARYDKVLAEMKEIEESYLDWNEIFTYHYADLRQIMMDEKDDAWFLHMKLLRIQQEQAALDKKLQENKVTISNSDSDFDKDCLDKIEETMTSWYKKLNL